jgi:DNA-directed RNA polymerase subunit RPC12/RpoP
MYLCEYCIAEIKSRGEKIYVGELHSSDKGIKCEFCDEIDDVYECVTK